jgi:hypothetical protein
LREGGGILSLIGFPFLVIGALGSGVLRSAALNWGTVVMGFAFLAVGATLVFGRRWTIFDARQRRVIRQLGLLIPMQLKERSLSEFDAVVLALDSNSDSGDNYPVRLRARAGKDLKVCFSAEFAESRERAEFLARFLELDLVDRSTDHEVVLSPDQAGESLQQRLRSGARPERVAQPATMRSAVNESGGTVRIVIPGRRWAALPLALPALIPVSIAVYLLPAFFRRTDAPPDFAQLVVPAFVIIGAFGILPLSVAIHVMLRGFRETVVTASPTGLLFEGRGAWRRKTTSIPAADIMALDYGTIGARIESARRSAGQPVPEYSARSGSRVYVALKQWVSRGLLVKSRRGLFEFGAGLGGEELRYLQAVIVRVLGGF